jgi:hypothetical protein
MMLKRVDRFSVFNDVSLGHVRDVPDLQSLKALVGRYYSYIYSGETLLFTPPDSNVYALVIGIGWLPPPGGKLNCPVYKLRTRSSPQIKKEDLLTKSFTLPQTGASQYLGSRDGILVDKRRHVVMGHLIGDGDNKPTWLVEFELEWLFT